MSYMPSTALIPYQPPKVGFGEAIGLFFKGYVVWNARSTRAEYWWAQLFSTLVLGALYVLTMIGSAANSDAITGLFGFLYLAAGIGFFLPLLSVTIRRLHDTNRNGGWWWILLVPVAGPIVMLVFMLIASVPYATRWNTSLANRA